MERINTAILFESFLLFYPSKNEFSKSIAAVGLKATLYQEKNDKVNK